MTSEFIVELVVYRGEFLVGVEGVGVGVGEDYGRSDAFV